jgi:hypothetical protein
MIAVTVALEPMAQTPLRTIWPVEADAHEDA